VANTETQRKDADAEAQKAMKEHKVMEGERLIAEL